MGVCRMAHSCHRMLASRQMGLLDRRSHLGSYRICPRHWRLVWSVVMNWVLIIFIYAGPWAKGDSVALLNVGNFSSQQTCEVAANQASRLPANSAKEFRHVCVEVK